MIKKIFILLLFLNVFSMFASTGTAKNLEVFDAVINEISQRHYDGNFRQNHAQQIKKSRQKAKISVNFDALSRTINEFLHQLPDSHFGIIAPSDPLQKKVVPFENDTRLMESRSKVLVYDRGSNPVLQNGDEIISVNGFVPDENSRIGKAVYINNLLSGGDPDENIKLEIIRNGRKMQLDYYPEVLKKIPQLFIIGNMPPIAESYSSRCLNSKIAYICFNSFTPNAVRKLKKDVAGKFSNHPALVIDLRNNIGGIIVMGVNMASFLSSKKVDFGKLKISEQLLNPKSYPQKNRYRGKIYILISRNSYSTAEIFAQAMRESGDAVIIGEKSSGMCLPSTVIELPHEFKLQTIVGDFVSSSGVRIEGRGVLPDKIIYITPSDLQKGIDPHLEYIKSL